MIQGLKVSPKKGDITTIWGYCCQKNERCPPWSLKDKENMKTKTIDL